MFLASDVRLASLSFLEVVFAVVDALEVVEIFVVVADLVVDFVVDLVVDFVVVRGRAERFCLTWVTVTADTG